MALKGSGDKKLNVSQIAQDSPFAMQKRCWRLRKSIGRIHGLRDKGTRKEKMKRADSLSLLKPLRHEYGNSQSHGDTSQFTYVQNHFGQSTF